MRRSAFGILRQRKHECEVIKSTGSLTCYCSDREEEEVWRTREEDDTSYPIRYGNLPIDAAEANGLNVQTEGKALATHRLTAMEELPLRNRCHESSLHFISFRLVDIFTEIKTPPRFSISLDSLTCCCVTVSIWVINSCKNRLISP